MKNVYFYINGVLAALDDSEITISESDLNDSVKTQSFTLNCSPIIDSTQQGSINLKIKNSSSSVKSITWDWVDEAKNGNIVINNDTKTVNGVGESVFFNFYHINSGTYRVILSFNDSQNKVLYSCYETILVFAEFETDTWYGPSPYINSENEFVYDDSIGASFAQNINFLDVPNGSSLYLLWSNFEYEADSINNTSPIQNQIGGQIFTSFTEGMSITNPINCDSNYCFDSKTLYAPPYRYLNTYAGFGKDPGFNLNTIIYNIFYENPVFYSSMVLDNYLYFLFSINNYDPEYYIGRYGIQDKSVAFTESNINTTNDSVCTSFTVKHLSGTNSGILYYTIEATSTLLYRQPFEITENAEYTFISFNNDGNYKQANHYLNTFEKNNMLETYSLTKSLSVSDMIISGDYLYVLVYLSDMYEEYYTQELDSSYKLVEDNYLSTGGIIKFNESNSQTQQAVFSNDTKWTNPNTQSTDNKVLGLYTYPNNVMYYKYSDKNGYEKINETVSWESGGDTFNYYYYIPVQPSLESNEPSTQYLYGPRKFLSASATELVFIDDGGYIKDPVSQGAEPKTLPVNRIVTLNLSTETFTFVNVNATFSAKYSPMTNSFTTNPYSGGIINPDPQPGKP